MSEAWSLCTGEHYLFHPHSRVRELMDHGVRQTAVTQQKRRQSLVVFQDVLDLQSSS